MHKKLGGIGFIFAFLIILFLPLCITGLEKLTDETWDLTLNGYSDSYPEPELTIKEYWDGTFQTTFEKWWNHNFPPRSLFIKTYNQFRYSFFSKGSRAIGKDGNLFETGYLKDALILEDKYDFSLTENQSSLELYVKQLEEIQTILEARGKHLILFLTLNKADYEFDDIPLEFKLKTDQEGKMRGIEYLRELLAQTNLQVVDSAEILKNYTDSPIFYHTGIHWSQSIDLLICQALMQAIGDITNQPVKNIILQSLEKREEPYSRDSDLYDLLNIFWGKQDPYYYRYNIEVRVPNGARDFNILLQGGSFADGFIDYYSQYNLGGIIRNIFYDESYTDRSVETTYMALNDFSDLDWDTVLADTDVLIIELNPAVIWEYSRGFVSYLSQILPSLAEK